MLVGFYESVIAIWGGCILGGEKGGRKAIFFYVIGRVSIQFQDPSSPGLQEPK